LLEADLHQVGRSLVRADEMVRELVFGLEQLRQVICSFYLSRFTENDFRLELVFGLEQLRQVILLTSAIDFRKYAIDLRKVTAWYAYQTVNM